MYPFATVGDESVWARRYREINEWERYLVDNGTRVVKVYLNLSRGEQAKRFLTQPGCTAQGQCCERCSTSRCAERASRAGTVMRWVRR